jgi:hypothetical protein
MNLEQIKELQQQNGLEDLQNLIDSGQAWHMEGACGREAMHALEVGACLLPEESHIDYWGNKVPNLNEVKPGTTGSLNNAIQYWTEHLKSESIDELHESN